MDHPSKRKGGQAAALGRQRGSLRKTTSKGRPGYPAKEYLKEPRHSVQSIRPVPIPSSGQKSTVADEKSGRWFDLRSYMTIDERLNALLDGDDQTSHRRVLGIKQPRTKLIYQKWCINHESWNLKRSPRLRRLKNSLAKVKGGRNPFYQFKDLFQNVKIRNLGEYNRYKAILEDGFLLTGRSIGIWITPQIRRVKSLSIREMEIVISKLPFWATSYEFSQIRRLALMISNHGCLVRACETNVAKAETGLPPGPNMFPWCVLNHVPTDTKVGR
jgi:hypothetical protein